MPSPVIIALFSFVLACCAVDLRARRIPNALSGAGALLGLCLSAAYFGSAGVASGLLGVLVMIAVLLAPFALGGLGAGDVKMMAAVGAFLGPRLAVLCLLAGMVVGGVVMALHLARLGRLGEKLAALKAMVIAAGISRSVAPLRIAADDTGAISLPYSIPLGLGTAVVVMATTLHHSTSVAF
jgi:prepilin peptidase CpaA